MISISVSNFLSAKIVALGYWRISFFSSILATVCSGFIRFELNYCFIQISELIYFSIITVHGLLFVFFVLVPIGQGYLNWWIPGQCGEWDFIWPRLNLFSLIGTEFSLFIFILFWLPGGWSSGWTMYPPLSIFQFGWNIDFIIGSLHILGIVSGISSCNTIVSISQINLPYCYKELSLFVWCQFITSILLLGSIPSLALALFGILFDRIIDSSWFDPIGGGDPILYQILFWFFGHPEVYVIILPSFGSISISLESSSTLYGRDGMISSITCLGILGFLVYGHHMFTVDLEMEMKLLFSSGTMAIAIPTGIKVYSWLMSLRSGNSDTKQVILPIICFITTFVGGGITGIILSSSLSDVFFHDTYFVVGHFHQVMAISSLLGFTCSIHLLGKLFLHGGSIVIFTIGTMIIFLPMYNIGISGIPRRIPSLNFELLSYSFLGIIGYLLSIIGLTIFLLFFI